MYQRLERFLLTFNLVFSSLLVLSMQNACSPSSALVNACQSTADCDLSSVCIDGICRVTCNYQRDCHEGEACTQGVCIPGADAGLPSYDAAMRDRNTSTNEAGSDASQVDAHTTSDASFHDHLAFDNSTNDSALQDAASTDRSPADSAATDNFTDPCDSISCPENMHCVDDNTGPVCLCGTQSCAAGESCLLPHQSSAHGGDVSPACCQPNEHNCAGSCVDFTSDESNCGSCDQACGFGETCNAGVCDCGDNGPCSADQDCCNGVCRDVLTDSDYCGSPGTGAGCSNACSGGQPCSNGACGCSAPSDCGSGDWTCNGNCQCDGVVCGGVCIGGGDCCSATDCSTTDSCTDWSSCEFADSCAQSGSQSQSCPRLTCQNNHCVQEWVENSQDCTRNTEGLSCNTTSYGQFSGCGGFANLCDTTGTKTRSVTTYTCGGGTCTSDTSTETQNCTRNTDGDSCGSTSYGNWGTCGGFSNSCDESGTQSRSVTTYTCGGGTCASDTSTDTQSCTRNTDGLSCGSTSYGNWGTCGGFTDTCDESGTQSRSVTTYTCGGGTCGSDASTETQSCTRDTDGLSCGTNISCCGGSCACGGPTTTVPKVAAGDEHSCAITSGGALYCWGRNDKGQLGIGSTTEKHAPTRVGSTSDWNAIIAGRDHSCGIRGSSIYCWGANESNQLGDGGTSQHNSPVGISTSHTANSSYVMLDGSYRHNCAIKSDHSMYCWGYNIRGQIGNNSTTNQSTPLKIGSSVWKTVTAGGVHTCAIKTDGSLWCWGSNYEGQCGLGATSGPFKVPTQVGTAKDWVDVQSSSGYHTCALKSNGSLWCWGGDSDNDYRNYGNTPVQVGSGAWKILALGTYSDYATGSNGTLWSWGDDEYGRLGNGNQSSKSDPYQISTSTTWTYIDGGYGHACAMQGGSTLLCTGENNHGQLGNNSTTPSQSLTSVGSPFIF